MSLNNSINAVIALLENRPKLFREILRQDNTIENYSEVTIRLYKALDKAIASEIRNILKDCLRVNLDIEILDKDNIDRSSYLAGIRIIESTFESRAEQLEG